MINVRKFIHPSLKNSNNILHDIFIPLNKRIGFINGTTPIVPIYSYRYIGAKANIKEYYEELNRLDKDLSQFKDLYLKFLSSIPSKSNLNLTDKLQFVWNRSNFESFDKVKIEILITLLRGNGSLPNVSSSLLTSTIEEAFSYILDLYLKKEPNVNLTKVKNFTLKLLSWINDFVPNLVNNFNLNSKNTDSIINPKVVYFGDIKKHEVYFLIFLSRLGCDILYINSPKDGDFSIIDKEGHYSKILMLPNKIILNMEALPVNYNNQSSPFNNASSDSSVKPTENFNIDKYKNSLTAACKISNDIFKDFSLSLSKRGSFIGKPLPLIPVYFYRYIGIKDKEAEYYNDLYKLDKSLESFNTLYFKITCDLPVENNTELLNKTAYIWRTVPYNKLFSKDILMQMLVESKAFPDLRENIINSSIIKSFYNVLDLYLSQEPGLNSAKIKNFVLKLVMWIHRYIPDLFKRFDYLKNSDAEIYNPKVLYYGDIKKHEAYFLVLLSMMGCDILYINSKDDMIFEDIDKDQKYSKVLDFPNRADVKEFPKEEIILRHETTAFKASLEIGSVIYNEEDGLFRPWQFESYKTHPLTLKTTFDELKILWNEEARMRPGFKIENGTVYIPNLYAKISGTHGDLNTYWSEFKELKNVDNLLFIPKIPYIQSSYSRYDLYSLEYCFKDGLVNKESLLNHRLYKFSYLKTPLQDGIIDKVNQLINLSILRSPIDEEFKLKILICILNLDKNILELIQKFDYPFKVPKVLIYDNDETIFSEEDSIILAFLNLIGFDIAIFTPTGYNNIEARIYEEYYDIHKLEDIKFNLEMPNLNSIRKNKGKSNSFWSNLFK